MKMLRNLTLLLVTIVSIAANAQVKKTKDSDNKMNQFISSLMSKMTLDEKIGQLNLLTPGGGVATGAVVSSDVETKIKDGSVGGLFGVIGVDKIRQTAQKFRSVEDLKFYNSDLKWIYELGRRMLAESSKINDIKDYVEQILNLQERIKERLSGETSKKNKEIIAAIDKNINSYLSIIHTWDIKNDDLKTENM